MTSGPPLPDDVIAARLAAIVESSNDAIVSKTLDGVITSWNPAAELIFGYSAAEAIGQHITLIIPVERHAEEAQVLARLRRGETVDHFETIRRTKDGRLIDVSLTVSPVRDRTGRIVGASKIARDITERRRLESERAELLAQAQTANRVKDEFLATLSHELRNPLAAIASAVHLMSASPGAPVAEPAKVIERQVAYLRRLIDDLLDAARIRAGKIRLELQPVRVADAVRRAIGVLRGLESLHAIDLDATDDVVVNADAIRLEQILLNLLTNALKHTPPGKAIRVTVGAEGSEAVVRVHDQGTGLSADALDRIFEMFAQARPADAGDQSGLGIGLAVARNLAELHGGTLTAASEGLGRGSTFTVRLPRTSRPLAAEAGPPALARAAVPRRVLIVEDNEDARTMLRFLIESLGHEVFAASDGAEAIELVPRVQPDLTLVDVGLPVINGYDVARHVRSYIRPPARLVALTGYGLPEDRARCLAAGFDDHVVKPIDPERLGALLSRLG